MSAYDGSFRNYMRAKVSKLKDQEKEISKTDSKIFAGISVHVNGFTNPSHQVLKELVCQHGGEFEHYYSRSRVTHIIANYLPDSKQRLFQNEKVVRPDWVTQSIEAGRLLPWQNFIALNQIPSQPKLSAFTTTANASTTSSNVMQTGSSSSSSSSTTVNPPPRAQLQAQPQPQPQPQRQFQPFVPHTPTPPRKQFGQISASSPSTPSSTLNLDLPNDEVHDVQDMEIDRGEGEGEEEDIEAPVNESDVPSFIQNGAPLDMNDEWIRKNTSVAPDFVEKYFKSSRLHYISTWKLELRKLMMDKMAEKRGKVNSNTKYRWRVIMHIDMDCFFAQVAVLDKPHLANAPVAVAHGQGSTVGKSTSEIASCNYPAREFGIRNGMNVGAAKELCPNLHVLPYEFDKYNSISKQMYSILLDFSDDLMACSVDEAYIDVSSHFTTLTDPTDLSHQIIHLAESIRSQIFAKTHCTASIGISENMLLARMATKQAKPDGCFYLTHEEIDSFLKPQKVTDLPGVGWHLRDKMISKSIVTCDDLQSYSRQELRNIFGNKTGEMLYDYARGIDTRPLMNTKRSSIGAEINWGIRFENIHQVETFMKALAKEVATRLQSESCLAKTVTVKIKKRKPDTGEPTRKFLGCGWCDNFSKSTSLSVASDDGDVLFRETIALLKSYAFDVADLRGLGIQCSKLVDATEVGVGGPGSKQMSLMKAFANAASNIVEQSAVRKVIPQPQLPQPQPQQRQQQEPIDPTVFAALPKQIQDEILRDYNLGNQQQQQQPPSQPTTPTKRKLTDFGVSFIPSPNKRPTPSTRTRTRTPSKRTPQKQPKQLPRASPTGILSQSDMLPRASQIDPSVFDSLPKEIQQEFQSKLVKQKVVQPDTDDQPSSTQHDQTFFEKNRLIALPFPILTDQDTSSQLEFPTTSSPFHHPPQTTTTTTLTPDMSLETILTILRTHFSTPKDINTNSLRTILLSLRTTSLHHIHSQNLEIISQSIQYIDSLLSNIKEQEREHIVWMVNEVIEDIQETVGRVYWGRKLGLKLRVLKS